MTNCWKVTSCLGTRSIFRLGGEAERLDRDARYLSSEANADANLVDSAFRILILKSLNYMASLIWPHRSVKRCLCRLEQHCLPLKYHAPVS